MGHDLGAHELAEIGDAPDLGQPAAAADIGLHHAHLAAGQPFPDFEARRRGFRATDPDRRARRELGMAIEIVVLQRRLSEQDVAIPDPVEHEQRVVPITPTIAEIDRHLNIIAEHLSPAPDQVHQLAVGDEVVEQHLHLHRAEADR